jgi:hypothetical protein
LNLLPRELALLAQERRPFFSKLPNSGAGAHREIHSVSGRQLNAPGEVARLRKVLQIHFLAVGQSASHKLWPHITILAINDYDHWLLTALP